MRKIILLILFFSSLKTLACSCECKGDCSFSAISNSSSFVALVKVLEYSDFEDKETAGIKVKMPLSMTVEVIDKYLGSETRRKIKIWGDNGVLCRPYISNFEIGNYYLIAPSIINKNSDYGAINDYDFFSCWTDYMEVDFKKKIAYGNYSKTKNQVELNQFEKEIKNINFKNSNWFVSNENNHFYNSDTLTIYKIINRKDKLIKLNEGLIKSSILRNQDFTDLHFRRSDKLKIIETDVDRWEVKENSGIGKWSYNQKKQIIHLSYENKIDSYYRIFEIRRQKMFFGEKDVEGKEGKTVFILALKLKRQYL